MSHEFFVGQRVVCIKKGPWVLKNGTDTGVPKPKHGEICTVSDTVYYDGLRLILAEYGQDDAFASKHFRPLRERKSDISLFRAILNGHRVPEEVE